MVEIYVPFLLVLMSWNADDPAGSMHVETRLYLDQQACEARGAEIEAYRQESHEGGFAWRCVEYDPVIEVYRPRADAQ